MLSVTVTLQEGGVISMTSTIVAVDEAKSTKPVAKLPTPSSTEEIHDIDMAASDSSMGSGKPLSCS